MTFTDYQTAAQETAHYPEMVHPRLYPTIGLGGETGKEDSMQYISFQCKQCESEVKYNPSQLEVPIGSGIRCPFCGAHYVLELIPRDHVKLQHMFERRGNRRDNA